MLTLLFLHFIGDFLLQSDWMALGKSKRLLPLVAHVAVYAACFLPFLSWRFAIITFAFHLVQDMITSQWTTKLWFLPLTTWYDEEKDELCYQAYPKWHLRHWFFVAIGFDQLLHYTQLVLTAALVS